MVRTFDVPHRKTCFNINHFAVMSALLPSILLAGLPAQARSLTEVKRTGTLLLATSADFEPFNGKVGGRFTGFEVELAEAIAARLDLKPVWTARPFDQLLNDVNTRQGTIDVVIASHAITSTRLKTVDFSQPHYCTGGVILTRKGGPQTSQALQGRQIGAEANSTYLGYVQKLPFKKQIEVFTTSDAAIQATATGQVEAVVTDRFAALNALNQYPKANLVMSDTLWREQIGMAFAKGNSALRQAVNKALAQIMQDGTYDRISRKYFGQNVRC
jgi:polar amino acid transport system substrate-binding protein